MSNQIPVLYTEQKTKKVKIWLDGFLVPRGTLNSARLISAGKHEIDIVFYSSIDEIKPGKEFQTDRYLITVEEFSSNDQPCPRPSYAVTDPTMKNRPKAAFVPPRLISKPESITTAPMNMNRWDQPNSNSWGYAGTTPSMKRRAYDEDQDEGNDTSEANPSKFSRLASFVPPKIIPKEPNPIVEPLKMELKMTHSDSELRPNLRPDTIVHPVMTNKNFKTTSTVPDQSPQISVSWSNWDESKSDEEESPPITNTDENESTTTNVNNAKLVHNWHSLVQSTLPLRKTNNQNEPSESMPNFNFEEQSIDDLFDELDE